jgi:hypothetical protein
VAEELHFMDDPDIGDDIPVEWKEVRAIQDPDFLELIYTFVPDALEDQNTKYYKPKQAEAWRMRYAMGMTTDHLSDEFGVSKSVFTNSYTQGGWISIFNKEVAGYAAEYALQHKYYPSCEVYGKNNPAEPDLYDTDSGLMVEVKLRHRKEAPHMGMFSKTERKNILEGKPTRLAMITYSPGKCHIQVYEPQLLSNPTNPEHPRASGNRDTESPRRSTPEPGHGATGERNRQQQKRRERRGLGRRLKPISRG